MIVKTKKFALDKKFYIKKSFSRHIKTQWKWLLIPAVIGLAGLVVHLTGVYKNWWILITAIIGAIGYLGFWYAQFYAATQMDQNAQMFDRFAYEIDSRQILVKLNAKEGGMVKWDTIQAAEKEENGYLLIIGKGQFLHFPNKVFNSEHDMKLFESILRRKELLKA